MRVLVLREGNVPQVIDLRDTSLLSVTRTLGASSFHGHVLERRASNGNTLMVFYAGPGETRYTVAPLAPRRPAVIANVGPHPDQDLTSDDVLALCQDAVLQEVGVR